jgi:tRNA(adenine34) deaminase
VSPELTAEPGAITPAALQIHELGLVSRDHHWMGLALVQARAALAHEDVPVGCVLVDDATHSVVATARNRREVDLDPTAHAEVLVLRAAGGRVIAAPAPRARDGGARGAWRLEGTTLYVTLEPCPMCAGALVNARVARVVYAAPDAKAGAAGSVMDLCRDPRLNHRLEVRSGVRCEEAAELLRSFFRARRSR